MRRITALLLSAAALLAPGPAMPAPASLGQSIAMNRLVTPNGDGYNDTFVFRCHNPRDSAVDARIYDVSGRQVAKMRLKQRSNGVPPAVDNVSGVYYDLEWDPNASGHSPGGIYIYQIALEQKVYKGTVTVIR